MLGLGGRGNLSEVPVLGGVNTDRGRRGSCLAALRRPWREGGLKLMAKVLWDNQPKSTSKHGKVSENGWFGPPREKPMHINWEVT